MSELSNKIYKTNELLDCYIKRVDTEVPMTIQDMVDLKAQPADEIWYNSDDKVTLKTNNYVVSHTWSCGRGIVKASGRNIHSWFRGTKVNWLSFGSNFTNIANEESVLAEASNCIIGFPEHYTNCPKNMLQDNQQMTSLNGGLPYIISDKISSIGNGAFSYLYINQQHNSHIYIPSNITSIEQYAFQYAYLGSISIPNTVTTIGSNAFGGITSSQPTTIYCEFAENAVSGAPWGGTNSTIYYNSWLLTKDQKPMIHNVPDSITLYADENVEGTQYMELTLDVAEGATVTAGTNLTLVDTPTAGKRNICVCRWSGGVCKLYVTIVEDLPQA